MSVCISPTGLNNSSSYGNTGSNTAQYNSYNSTKLVKDSTFDSSTTAASSAPSTTSNVSAPTTTLSSLTQTTTTGTKTATTLGTFF